MSNQNNDRMWSEQFIDVNNDEKKLSRAAHNRNASDSLTWVSCFLMTLIVFILGFTIQLY